MLEALTILNIFCALITKSNNFSKKEILFKRCLYFINFFLLTLHDGLRWEIGVDWGTYKNFWDTLTNFDKYIFDQSQILSMHVLYKQDPFYVGFIRFLHDNISQNYTIYLLIFSTLSYGLILFSLYYLTQYSLLSLSFIPGYIAWYSGSQRQFLAISFFLLCLYFLENKKFKYFFIFGLIALKTHSTTFLPLFFILSLYIPNIFNKFRLGQVIDFITKYKNIFLTLLVIFLFYIGYIISVDVNLIGLILTIIPLKSLNWFEYLASADAIYGNPFFGLLRRLFNLSFITYLFYSSEIFFKNKVLLGYFKASQIISLVLYSFSLILPQFSLASRLDLYAGVLGIAVLTGKFFNTRKLSTKYIALFLAISFLIIQYSRHDCLTLFHPYHFFFEKNIPSAFCNFND